MRRERKPSPDARPGHPPAHTRNVIAYTITRDAILNRALAAARAPVERDVARLKTWQIFRRSRCSPNRMTSIAKAILTLERQR
jgi:hypothetical protein